MFDFHAACRLNLFVESKKLFVSSLTLQRDMACARLISTKKAFYRLFLLPFQWMNRPFSLWIRFKKWILSTCFITGFSDALSKGAQVLVDADLKPLQLWAATALWRNVPPCTHACRNTRTHAVHLCGAALHRADSRVKELDICFPNHLRHLLSVCAEREVSQSPTKAPFIHQPYLSKRVPSSSLKPQAHYSIRRNVSF